MPGDYPMWQVTGTGSGSANYSPYLNSAITLSGSTGSTDTSGGFSFTGAAAEYYTTGEPRRFTYSGPAELKQMELFNEW